MAISADDIKLKSKKYVANAGSTAALISVPIRIFSVHMTSGATGEGLLNLHNSQLTDDILIQIRAPIDDSREILFYPAGVKFENGLSVGLGNSPDSWMITYLEE
jgi:hypothetical protein